MKASRQFCSTPGARHPKPDTRFSDRDLPGGKTKSQLVRIITLQADLRMSEKEMRDVCEKVSGQRSRKYLSKNQADAMIKAMGGTPLLRKYKSGEPSKRTQQLHRQRAGVISLASHAQREKIRELALANGITEDGWQAISARVNGGKKIPQTSPEAQRVIEALKSMLRRKKGGQAA